jgi:hypothetical protein
MCSLTPQCVLGYALAPILLASIVSTLVHNLFVRIPVSLACWAWSVWGECDVNRPLSTFDLQPSIRFGLGPFMPLTRFRTLSAEWTLAVLVLLKKRPVVLELTRGSHALQLP